MASRLPSKSAFIEEQFVMLDWVGFETFVEVIVQGSSKHSGTPFTYKQAYEYFIDLCHVYNAMDRLPEGLEHRRDYMRYARNDGRRLGRCQITPSIVERYHPNAM
jgi:hypothetical protein